MGLRELVLAAVVTTLPLSASADQRTRLGLGLKYGFSQGNDQSFNRKEASLGINGYLINLSFLKEEEEREEPDTVEVSGLRFEGTRRHRTHQANVGFGYEVTRWQTNPLHLALIGHVTGGIQLETSYLQLKGERIPGNPYLDFLLGGGVILELVHPIAYWTRIPVLRHLELGIGATAEYLSEQVDITKPQSGIYVGGHGLIRMGRK